MVNAVVGADPVPDLKSFVDAVTNNAKDLHGRVAFVIGVNARNTPEGQASVDRALAQMKGVLDTIDHPVALTGFTWKMPSSENVPFGTMRNNTLHSKANHLVTDALWSKGTHPYIAVQDFDTGSRNVPSGKHIFNHVIDSMAVGDGLPPSRPLMFGGGYRLGAGGKETLVSDTHDRRVRAAKKDEDERDEFPAEKKQLAAQIQQHEKEIADLEAKKKAAPRGSKNDVITPSGKTVKDLKNEVASLKEDDDVKAIDKLSKNIAKLNDATKNNIDKTDFVEDLDRRITQDMDTRVVLAKTNPLLPYTPEPNLFVDAIATKLHSDIKFGNGAAEFSHLGEKLQEAYAKELGELHDHQTGGIKDDINKKIAAINEKDAGQGNPISRDQARAMIEQDPELMNAMREIEDQRSNLEVDAQNNRHPVRGEVFITDFKGAAVETDLSRLALGYAHKNIVPQSHTDLTGVADRFFDGKTAKKGTSVSGFRDEFPNHAGNLREPTNLGRDKEGRPARTYTPEDGKDFIPKKGVQESKSVAEALGLGDEAANGRGHEEPVSNPLSKSISAPVPSRDHGGVVAGISPQPKDVPGENTVDHHKAFAAVNTAMSGPEALMQRKFGALGNIADLPETLPPAKGGLFDAVAGPRGLGRATPEGHQIRLVADFLYRGHEGQHEVGRLHY